MTRYPRLLFSILKINTQNDLAYFGETWGDILSTIAFGSSFIFSVKLLLSRLGNIGGYDEAAMLFLIFLAQVQLFYFSNFVFISISSFHQKAREGTLDTLLIRPANKMFILIFRELSPMMLARTFPIMSVYVLLIKWGNLGINLKSFALGSVIFMMFVVADTALMLCWGTKTLLSSSPDNALLGLYWRFHGASTEVPQHLVPGKIMASMALLVPSIPMVSVSGAVMMNRLDFGPALLIAASSMLVLVSFCVILWKFAMIKYNSASS